jgi:hypothetical protein
VTKCGSGILPLGFFKQAAGRRFYVATVEAKLFGRKLVFHFSGWRLGS